MATYEPPPELLERQLESIRRQTNDDWLCLISDDHSSPERFAALESMVGDDPRFVVSRGEARVGFFHNFERALRLVPPGVEFIALADQDDRWDLDKLDLLRAAIGPASLAYSDARVVSADGELLSPTYWSRRRNNHTDLTSLTLANTVSGSAALFRRRVVDLALPFPPAIAGFYHDHWLALVGLATGSIAYVDRPLYDYVQHEDAVLGHERSQAWGLEGRGLRSRLAHFRAEPDYFYEHWRTTYFREYCRVAVMARLLLMRCGPQLSEPRRRALGRLADPERSPTAIGWLALRQFRRLAGHNETVGAEGRLLRAFAWRRLLAAQPRDQTAARGWLPREGGFPHAVRATAEPTLAPPTP
jgi:glycosyltransferase involved in cell wall biosynthesis